MDKALAQLKSDNSKTRIGYLIAFLLLLISYLITLYNNKTLTKQQNMISHTYELISKLEDVQLTLSDAETGVRGYIITGNSVFLQPYYNSVKNIDSLFIKLKYLVTDNKLQLNNYKSLKLLSEKRLNTLKEALIVFDANGKKINDSLMKSTPGNKLIIDQLRSKISEMKNLENDLLITRKKEREKYDTWLDIVTFISSMLAAAFIVFGFLTYQKEHKERVVAYKKILDYQSELNKQVVHLNDLNSELITMRLQEKFASTGRIARQIAHEIRNPLTNINLATNQLVVDLAVKNEDALNLFDIINRNSERINSLISDLLNSTKFAELHFTKNSMNTIINDALKMVEDRIGLTNGVVKTRFNTFIPEIYVDPEKLKVVFVNLIINAIEACSNTTNPTILIQTELLKDMIRIKVSDNGQGIDEEGLNKLFEPYYTTKQKGNGLGLTNTQNIILNHKGEISVSSKVNEGTTFSVCIPLNKNLPT